MTVYRETAIYLAISDMDFIFCCHDSSLVSETDGRRQPRHESYRDDNRTGWKRIVSAAATPPIKCERLEGGFFLFLQNHICFIS